MNIGGFDKYPMPFWILAISQPVFSVFIQMLG